MATEEVEQVDKMMMVRLSRESRNLLGEVGRYNETLDDIVKRIALAYRDWGRDFEEYRQIVPGCSCLYYLVEKCPVHKDFDKI